MILAIVIAAGILIAVLFVDVQLIASCLVRRLPSNASRTAFQAMIPAMDVAMVAFAG
jgi:hypothetical protein